MVNGLGGRHEFALWCDLVIVSDNAVFGQTGARVGACPTVGATQYIPRLVGGRLAREMIFLWRTLTVEEAVNASLINRVVLQKDLLKETELWCERIKSCSSQTLRSTKINCESDELYASWRHGMELLTRIRGSKKSLEGMRAFLEKRKPDFGKFRERNRRQVADYLAGLDRDENQAGGRTGARHTP